MGVYEVAFKVDGLWAEETSDWEAWGRRTVNLTAYTGRLPLVADAGGPYSGTAGSPVSLSGSASDGTPPYDYAWDLDNDGEYDDSIAQNPSYTWTSAGDYTVGLRVTDNAASTDTNTASVDITAAAPPATGVGGTAYLPNKLAILAPWMALGLGIILVAGIAWLALKRRRVYR